MLKFIFEFPSPSKWYWSRPFLSLVKTVFTSFSHTTWPLIASRHLERYSRWKIWISTPTQKYLTRDSNLMDRNQIRPNNWYLEINTWFEKDSSLPLDQTSVTFYSFRIYILKFFLYQVIRSEGIFSNPYFKCVSLWSWKPDWYFSSSGSLASPFQECLPAIPFLL